MQSPQFSQPTQPHTYPGRHRAGDTGDLSLAEYTRHIEGRTELLGFDDRRQAAAPLAGAPTVKALLDAHAQRWHGYDPQTDPDGRILHYRTVGPSAPDPETTVVGRHRQRSKHRR